MKRLACIVSLITLAGLTAFVKAQTPDAVFQKVTTAFQSRDAVSLSALFNASVELTVPGSEGVYAAKQAQFVLRDFFANYPVSSFRLDKKGNSGTTHYATGVYVSGKGTFDTNIFIRNMGGNFVVTEVRIEAE